MAIFDEILILADERVGTYSQAIALAEELCLPYRLLKLEYSFLATLPNFIFGKTSLRLSKSSQEMLKTQENRPSIIISSGRKSACIALYLKKLWNFNQNLDEKTYLIQIMNPEFKFSEFDFVILPCHDLANRAKFNFFGRTKKSAKNLIISAGALTRINHSLVLSEKQKFITWFEQFKKPIIALMVGGNSKDGFFAPKSGFKLAVLASKIAKNMQASLVVLTSPRTDENLLNSIKSGLSGDFKIYDWQKLGELNPYFAVVGYADFFIISGDSVSMISDCCCTGKPVYIFDEKNLASKKHRIFHQFLLKGGFAKLVHNDEKKLEYFAANKLNEANRIAAEIRKKIFPKHLEVS